MELLTESNAIASKGFKAPLEYLSTRPPSELIIFTGDARQCEQLRLFVHTRHSSYATPAQSRIV